MSLGTQCKTGAPTIEVLVHKDGQLLVREPVETGDDAAAVVERWSDAESVDVLPADVSVHVPRDDLASAELPAGDDEDRPIAAATIPGWGTE